MATKEVVTRVWIEEGCIVCDACEAACPEVFQVTEDSCIIRPAAMAAEFNKPLTGSIRDAAEECPVDVIKFETMMAEVSDEAPTAADPPAEPASAKVPAAVPAKPKPAAAAKKADKPAAKSAAAALTDDETDPAIAALLRAAATRGGNAGILRSGDIDSDEWRRTAAAQLPPDARQAKLVEAAKKASKDPDAGRRTVAGGAALAVGWVAFGTGLGVSIGPAFGRFMMPNVLEEPDPRIRIGPKKRYLEMAVGEVNEDYKPQGIWMIRLDDRIAALNIICTHLGCIPNWLPNDKKYKCPCHGSGYTFDGINFEGPTPRPLERFKILEEGGIVVVDKSKKYQHELGQWDQKDSFLPV